MSTRANSSRERILTCSAALILSKGFAGTSIEDILDKAAITKGGFFYHFESKAGLAKALVERYLEEDNIIFSDLFKQADSLSEDPLHQMLIFLKLFAEMMSNLEDTHPGCLVASFTYESQQFDDEIRDLVQQGIISWRNMFVERIENVVEKYPLNKDVSISTLADMFTSSIEGGIILSRACQNKQLLVDQINAYRHYLRLLFQA